jgi:catechol 2,3-dioxygenase-like lactoylglutathione lyase family enzyme
MPKTITHRSHAMSRTITERLAPVAPEFFVRDVDASIEFYVDKLGFTLVRADPEGDGRHSFAVLARGEAEFLFVHESALGPANRAALPYPRAAGVDIRLMVEDVDGVYASVRARGVDVVLTLDDRPYGLRDFIISDADGYRIRFAQRIA